MMMEMDELEACFGLLHVEPPPVLSHSLYSLSLQGDAAPYPALSWFSAQGLLHDSHAASDNSQAHGLGAGR